jgi:hypothetical protein
LHRYCDELDFRRSNRTVKDAERREIALKQVEGQRLMYKSSISPSKIAAGFKSLNATNIGAWNVKNGYGPKLRGGL